MVILLLFKMYLVISVVSAEKYRIPVKSVSRIEEIIAKLKEALTEVAVVDFAA